VLTWVLVADEVTLKRVLLPNAINGGLCCSTSQINVSMESLYSNNSEHNEKEHHKD
jgi:hypothetical protein